MSPPVPLSLPLSLPLPLSPPLPPSFLPPKVPPILHPRLAFVSGLSLPKLERALSEPLTIGSSSSSTYFSSSSPIKESESHHSSLGSPPPHLHIRSSSVSHVPPSPFFRFISPSFFLLFLLELFKIS